MKRIKALAESLYKKYGTCDPFRLCEELGINLFFMKMPEATSGLYYRICQKQVILINQSLKEPRKKFVAAHELGHALLHPDANSFFIKTKTAFEIGRFERQADYFAACLLTCSCLELAEFCDLSLEGLSALTGADIQTLEYWRQNQ